MIIQQLRTSEKSNIVDMKSVIIEHPEILHKLSKTEKKFRSRF